MRSCKHQYLLSCKFTMVQRARELGEKRRHLYRVINRGNSDEPCSMPFTGTTQRSGGRPSPRHALSSQVSARL